jgi:SWI/SNF-related matrix-associated actin-dependent regulator 1 of chromatin subfamily A
MKTHKIENTVIETTAWYSKTFKESHNTSYAFRNFKVLKFLGETSKAYHVDVEFFSGISCTCGVCGRGLTNDVSKATGIGPVCAEKIGLPRPTLESAKETVKQMESLSQQQGQFTSIWIPKSQIKRIVGEGGQIIEGNSPESDTEIEIKLEHEIKVSDQQVTFKFKGGDFKKILNKMRSMNGRWDASSKAWSVSLQDVKNELNELKILGFNFDKSVEEAEIEKPLMQISIEGDTAIVNSPYNAQLVNFFRNNSGFIYNASNHSRKININSGAETLKKLIDFARNIGFEVDDSISPILDDLKQKKVELEITKKDFSIDLNLGMKVKPYPYQMAGIKFIDLSNGRAIVGDEMGLGKTMQALGWVAWKKKKALVICPNSYKLGWAREITKFTNCTSQVLGSKNVDFEQADFTIINYENIKKHDFSKLNYDTVIIDESHKIKNSKTQRFEACDKIVSKSKHVILLTGTAIVNRPVEFYTQLKMVSPSLVGSYGSYTAKFCGGHNNGYGWEANGATNLDELSKLISPIYIRRIKSEVLTELPSKIHQDIMIEGIKVKLNKDSKSALEEINNLKIALAKEKVNHTIEFVENMVENGDKVIVFSDYIDTAKSIADALGEKAVCYLSELSTEERFEIEKRFQEDDSIRVFVATMKVAGVALTLTAANKVCFNDLPWTPGDLRQCEDRAHRIGQKNSVNVYKMVAEGTLDEYINDLLNDKIRILDAVLDGKEISSSDRAILDLSIESKLCDMVC